MKKPVKSFADSGRCTTLRQLSHQRRYIFAAVRQVPTYSFITMRGTENVSPSGRNIGKLNPIVMRFAFES